jgi:hypothetical protein
VFGPPERTCASADAVIRTDVGAAEADGDAEADGEAEAEADGEADADGDADGDAEADAVGDLVGPPSLASTTRVGGAADSRLR